MEKKFPIVIIEIKLSISALDRDKEKNKGSLREYPNHRSLLTVDLVCCAHVQWIGYLAVDDNIVLVVPHRRLRIYSRICH